MADFVNIRAKNSYETNEIKIESQILKLNELLKSHKEHADNWCSVGDLNHVSEILAEAIEFLGGTNEQN